MYLHLGQNVVVPEKCILGVFDLDNASASHITREFLANAEKSRQVINVSDELPKSFVLYEEGGAVRVYISQLSAATLKGRSRRTFE